MDFGFATGTSFLDRYFNAFEQRQNIVAGICVLIYCFQHMVDGCSCKHTQSVTDPFLCSDALINQQHAANQNKTRVPPRGAGRNGIPHPTELRTHTLFVFPPYCHLTDTYTHNIQTQCQQIQNTSNQSWLSNPIHSFHLNHLVSMVTGSKVHIMLSNSRDFQIQS